MRACPHCNSRRTWHAWPRTARHVRAVTEPGGEGRWGRARMKMPPGPTHTLQFAVSVSPWLGETAPVTRRRDPPVGRAHPHTHTRGALCSLQRDAAGQFTCCEEQRRREARHVFPSGIALSMPKKREHLDTLFTSRPCPHWATPLMAQRPCLGPIHNIHTTACHTPMSEARAIPSHAQSALRKVPLSSHYTQSQASLLHSTLYT